MPLPEQATTTTVRPPHRKHPAMRSDDFPVNHKYGWTEENPEGTFHHKVENPEAFKPGCTGYVIGAQVSDGTEYEVQVRINAR